MIDLKGIAIAAARHSALAETRERWEYSKKPNDYSILISSGVLSANASKFNVDESFESTRIKGGKFNKNNQALKKMYAGAIESPSIAMIPKPEITGPVLTGSGDYL